MIRYSLVCGAGHGFESWFPSSGSYDDQAARGLVTCPVCGSAEVGKALMAPRLARTDRPRPPTATDPAAGAAPSGPAPAEAPAPPPTDPGLQMRAALRAFHAHLTANSEHVGARFPEEARRIHYGEAQGRAIHGQASPDEARALIDEGIDVAPLPTLPDERN